MTVRGEPTTEVDTRMFRWHSYRSVSRDELMTGALVLADCGWPILPGTFWQGRRWAGMPDAPSSGPVPVLGSGLAGATTDRTAIVEWWSELPYSVLLPTGSALDAIEVSPPIGRRLSAHLRESGVPAPAGTTPTGRWWFLVGAGEPLRPELASRSDVTLHGRGSWVVAPPSQDARGLVQWCVPPPVFSEIPESRVSESRVSESQVSESPVPDGPVPDSRVPVSREPVDQALPTQRRDDVRSGTACLPDTYDVQLALLEVLGQRSIVAAAASAVGAARAHRRPG